MYIASQSDMPRVLPIAVVSVLLAGCAPPAAEKPAAPSAESPSFEAWAPEETWKVQSVRVAPWAPPGPSIAADSARGREIRFKGPVIEGAVSCSDAQLSYVVSPAEGLFEGNLPAPADRAARAIGIDGLPLLTQRATCANGSYDFHITSIVTAYIGLSNEVWGLIRTSSMASPEATALELLRIHMTQDMGFTTSSVEQKSVLLTDGLASAIADYFARPFPQDEPPPINGDPFTNSQEYPSGFIVGKAVVNAEGASVPVRFENGPRRYVIKFELQQVTNRWRIDNLVYEDGSTFRESLDEGK